MPVSSLHQKRQSYDLHLYKSRFHLFLINCILCCAVIRESCWRSSTAKWFPTSLWSVNVPTRFLGFCMLVNFSLVLWEWSGQRERSTPVSVWGPECRTYHNTAWIFRSHSCSAFKFVVVDAALVSSFQSLSFLRRVHHELVTTAVADASGPFWSQSSLPMCSWRFKGTDLYPLRTSQIVPK